MARKKTIDTTALDGITGNIGTETRKAIQTATADKREYKEHKPATATEKARREAAMNTRGQKGCKLPRINTAYSTPNYHFVKVMSKASGRTMTKFINYIVDIYRQEHEKEFKQAQAFIRKLPKLADEDYE